MMLEVVAVLALSAQLLAPYLVWPDRWNIPAHIQAGFCITAYVIPGLFTDVWLIVPQKTVELFTAINVVGAICICLGTVGGAWIARKIGEPRSFRTLSLDPTGNRMIRRVIIVVGAAVVGIYIGYWIMGFIPMFADDPFAAKQFKGPYRDAYYRAAYLFRFSFSVISASIPLVLILAWQRRSPILLTIAGLAFIALLISLARGATATGILIFLGILAAKSKNGLKWYLPLVMLIFPFGSSFYYFAGQLLNITELTTINSGTSFSQFIASGAPDISDQLDWLYGFSSGSYWTYGRTIYGGLIPGNYLWNPSVWTISYFSVGADISESITGGLRLSTAEWGYANFGWGGVVSFGLLSGVFSGVAISYLKFLRPRLTALQMSVALLVYQTLGIQIVQFYFLSIHNLPAIAVMLFFWMGLLVKRSPSFRGPNTSVLQQSKKLQADRQSAPIPTAP
jgi:hypothetical protein